MNKVSEVCAQGQDLSVSSLCWSDPEAARQWLSRVESAFEDAMAAALDQMRPLRSRHLGHVEADRIVREASSSLCAALAHAKRGLPPAPAR